MLGRPPSFGASAGDVMQEPGQIGVWPDVVDIP
jgi:hypothetical protein